METVCDAQVLLSANLCSQESVLSCLQFIENTGSGNGNINGVSNTGDKNGNYNGNKNTGSGSGNFNGDFNVGDENGSKNGNGELQF